MQFHYARKIRQFRRLSEQVNRMLADGSFSRLGVSARQRLMQKLRHLYHRLSRVIPAPALRRALAGAAFVLGVGMSQQATAQTFAAPVADPFGIQSVNQFSLLSFGDLDGDGDQDIITGGYDYTVDYASVLKFYENTGAATEPNFAAPQTNPFGLGGLYYTNPEAVDLDGDGDLDILVGRAFGYSEILYFENTGTANAPAYGAPVIQPFGIAPVYYFSFVQTADMDNDGDYDLIGTSAFAGLYYQENTGTPTAPNFAASTPMPFGLELPGPYIIAFFDVADIDSDGDQDVFTYAYYNYYTYGSAMFFFENTGTPSAPAFGAGVQNPFGITAPNNYVFQPALVDIDGDGDTDLFLGNYYDENILYYENTAAIPNMAPSSDNFAVTTDEDTPYIFDGTEFPYSDNDGDPLSGVQIVSLPGEGSLTFDGSPLTAGTLIPAADLDQIAFTPDPGEFGAPYTSFEFQVSDGTDLSDDTFVCTINVDEISSTRDIAQTWDIQLSPNPAGEFIEVKTPGLNIQQADWRIFNNLGQTLLQGNLKNETIQLGQLPEGSYFLEITVDGERLTKPFVRK